MESTNQDKRAEEFFKRLAGEKIPGKVNFIMDRKDLLSMSEAFKRAVEESEEDVASFDVTITEQENGLELRIEGSKHEDGKVGEFADFLNNLSEMDDSEVNEELSKLKEVAKKLVNSNNESIENMFKVVMGQIEKITYDDLDDLIVKGKENIVSTNKILEQSKETFSKEQAENLTNNREYALKLHKSLLNKLVSLKDSNHIKAIDDKLNTAINLEIEIIATLLKVQYN